MARRDERRSDEERRLWVENDEGLYTARRRSGLSVRDWVRDNRKTIDKVIDQVVSGAKRPHFMVYG